MSSLPWYRIYLFLLAVVNLLLFLGKEKELNKNPFLSHDVPLACQHRVCTPDTAHSCADFSTSPQPAQQWHRQESVNPGGNWSVTRCNELGQNRAIHTGTNISGSRLGTPAPARCPPEPGRINLLCWSSTGSQTLCTNPNSARRQCLPGSPQRGSAAASSEPCPEGLPCWKGSSHLSCLPLSAVNHQMII